MAIHDHTRDAVAEAEYNWQRARGRSFLRQRAFVYAYSVVDSRFEEDTVAAVEVLLTELHETGQIRGEIASPEGACQFADRIERCAWCTAPYTDSEKVEAGGNLNYDLCPRCRLYPDDDPLLRAIDRGVDDEALERLIEHYGTVQTRKPFHRKDVQ